MINLSPAYEPVLIKGLRVHQDNPLALDFIVDTGDSGLKLDQASDKQRLSKESNKLIKYFLAALTLPEKDVWVNLSPYEKDRIIPAGLGQTEMGRDMLEQDYILKQITASLIYPEKGLGKEFWDKIYRQAYQRFGTTQVPINTFNKVWIVADKANVYENKDTAFVTGSHLKVMLEQDYLSLQKHAAITATNNTNDLGSQIVREIILPALEKEVNQGKNFANLRQIFHSLILAKWYKQALKQALINQVYSNKSKVAGVNVADKSIMRKIYGQYLRAYKKGVFNFIKEDIDQSSQQPLPRKYFSGGVVGSMAMVVSHSPQDAALVADPKGKYVLVLGLMGRASGRSGNPQNSQLVSMASYLDDQGIQVPEDTEINPFDTISTVNVSKANTTLLGEYADLRERQNNAAMNAGPANVWHRRGNPENVLTALSGTKAIIVLTDQERTEAKSVEIFNWDQKVSAAKDFLRSEYPDEQFNSTIKVKRVARELKYGFAIDHDSNVIYMSPSFLLKIQTHKASDYFDFFVRKCIFLLADNPQAGQRFEYDYAYQNFNQKVIKLFPEGSEPRYLLRIIEEGILLHGVNSRTNLDAYQLLAHEIIGGELGQLHFVSRLNKDGIYDAVQHGGIAVVEAGKSARAANEEVLERARDAMNIIGINALDGIADYNKGALQSTAQFSSKFNPISIAHTFITILYTYAISGAANYNINISEFDPRKPDIQKSYLARLSLALAEIKGFFHHLVSIIESNDEIRRWNGEEVAIILASKIHMLVNALHKYLYLYTAGGDHFYIWAPFNPSNSELFPTLIGFDEINDKTREYYSFYAGIGEGKKYGLSWDKYQELVRRQVEIGERKFYDQDVKLTDEQRRTRTLNMQERERVITAILEAKSEEEMNAVFESATILPRLDTAGKMVLAGKALPHIEFVLAHTVRKGENFGDHLRDELIAQQELKVFNVDGLNTTVAATRTREGLIAFLYGIVNFNLLYGASKPTLKKIFDRKDRGPLDTLLRQSPLILPKSIANMLHDNESIHHSLIENLKEKVKSLTKDPHAVVEEENSTFLIDDQDRVSERGKSIVTVNVARQNQLQIDYQVENTLDSHGNPVNLLHYEVVQNNLGNNGTSGINAHEVEQAILDYIRTYNNIKDAAMFMPERAVPINETAVSPGGIDFNANRLELSVRKQGSGVGINFDRAMIKRFENDDFQGFVPIIINITPIKDIAPMLGLN